MKNIAVNFVGAEFNLDQLLAPDSAARWLGIPERELLAKARTGCIPKFELGPKTLRFHPRTVLAHLAHKAGVNQETIAASFGHCVTATRNT